MTTPDVLYPLSERLVEKYPVVSASEFTELYCIGFLLPTGMIVVSPNALVANAVASQSFIGLHEQMLHTVDSSYSQIGEEPIVRLINDGAEVRAGHTLTGPQLEALKELRSASLGIRGYYYLEQVDPRSGEARNVKIEDLRTNS